MRLRDYFLGESVRLALPLPPGECRRAGRLVIAPAWSSVSTLIGFVLLSALAMFGMPLAMRLTDMPEPALHRRFVPDGGGAMLVARYRAPNWLIPGMIGWHVVLTGAVVLIALPNALRYQGAFLPVIVLLGLMVLPWAVLLFRLDGAEERLEEQVDSVRSACQ
jgi:hypothetical protein